MLLSDVIRKGCVGLVRSEFCKATGAFPGPAVPRLSTARAHGAAG
jgi:hypothetical protein